MYHQRQHRDFCQQLCLLHIRLQMMLSKRMNRWGVFILLNVEHICGTCVEHICGKCVEHVWKMYEMFGTCI